MDVVFHLSSGRVSDWTHALANVENLLADDTVDLGRVELLVNGDAVFLLVRDSSFVDRLDALLDRGVRVCACRNSLDAREIDAEGLRSEVSVVPSGVGELTTRQAAGDAYIKTP